MSAKPSSIDLGIGRDHTIALRKLAATTEAEIDLQVANDVDLQLAEDIDWNEADVVPASKTPISIRVDADVLAHFKAKGAGYQSRMNAVLRAFMEHEKAAR